MSSLTHFEYAPPKSWEQFEELCADLFEHMWSDPGLVRYGRAGQAQHGVDIICSRGEIYPVGLQCKKKASWPERSLTLQEVKAEIAKADEFTPALKEYYILTTAPNDVNLQNELIKINEARKEENKSLVSVLFWSEIIRKIALAPSVAGKHFPLASKSNEFSPLLATWFVSQGKIELSDDEWLLSFTSLVEDLYVYQTGRIIIRQRDTDELIRKIQKSLQGREEVENKLDIIKDRKILRKLKERERETQEIVLMALKNKTLNYYITELCEKFSFTIMRNLIESRFDDYSETLALSKIKIISPALNEPRDRSHAHARIFFEDFSINLPDQELNKIFQNEVDFSNKYYGNKISDSICELPNSVLGNYVIPRLISWIYRIIEEDKITIEELDKMSYLDLFNWRYSI